MLHLEFVAIGAPRHRRQIAAGIVTELRRVKRSLPETGQLRNLHPRRPGLYRLRQQRDFILPVGEAVLHRIQHHAGHQFPVVAELDQFQTVLSDRLQPPLVVGEAQAPAGGRGHLHQFRVAIGELPARVAAFAGEAPVAGLRTLLP